MVDRALKGRLVHHSGKCSGMEFLDSKKFFQPAVSYHVDSFTTE